VSLSISLVLYTTAYLPHMRMVCRHVHVHCSHSNNVEDAVSTR
jgi:hypothetical protein